MPDSAKPHLFFLFQERDEVEGKIEGERKGFAGCGGEESYKGI